jgi:single-stranded-DNA-specific exonuclease
LKWNISASNGARSDQISNGIPGATASSALRRSQETQSDASKTLEISPLTARVLWARGFRDVASARRFLDPSLEDLHDPYLLKSMPEAVARLRRAIDAKEPILLYGDYDVDGTTAVVILKKTLDLLGASVSFHVPHRLRDGYGMKSEVVEQAAAAGVRLIVSVDTGIRANDVVRHAAEFAIDVIITDHHLPESEIPPAVAVLNPNRRDCSYPEKNLCGAGVALKLADALITASGWDPRKRARLVESLLKLVAIATVADVVPLTGENRVIVKLGLAGLRSVRNPGLRAILDVSGLADGASPTAQQVAFQVAPRINASGRMASASDVIEMFLTDDESRARALAAQLHDLNHSRRQTEQEIARAIFEQCIEQPVTDLDCALVFAGEGWHRGVVGIVASRVVERFHRPAFVLGIENGQAQGSGRSIAAFHLLDALETMPELFTKFGGHRQAAGVTLAAGQLDEFRARFQAHAASLLTPADFEPSLEIDTEAELHEINDASVADLFRLAPFGFGNPSPVLVARGVEVAAAPDIKNEKHVFLKLISNGRRLRVKGWNFAHRADEFAAGARVDVVFSLEDDAFSAGRGYAPWQAILRDIRCTVSAQTAF